MNTINKIDLLGKLSFEAGQKAHEFLLAYNLINGTDVILKENIDPIPELVEKYFLWMSSQNNYNIVLSGITRSHI